MIGLSIKTNSISRALRDVRRTTKRKSFRHNKSLGRKISRRFRAAAKAGAKDLARPIARHTGLTLTQAKRRTRSSKKISSRRFRSSIFVRGAAQKVHSGRLRSLRVTKKGVKIRGKLVKGAFVTRETLRGKKELRRVLIREQNRIRALTETKQIPRVFRRAGPAVLSRHSRRLIAEISKLVRKA